MEKVVYVPKNDELAQNARVECGRVVQALSDRILVCEPRLDTASLKKLGLKVIETQQEFDALKHTLQPSEQLFIQAWLDSQTAAPKSRVGEGVDWDTPPFEAP